jgi:hypothetical protein
MSYDMQLTDDGGKAGQNYFRGCLSRRYSCCVIINVLKFI